MLLRKGAGSKNPFIIVWLLKHFCFCHQIIIREYTMPGSIKWTSLIRKLSPYMIRKGLLYLRHYGPKEFWIRLHERFEPEEIPYGKWYESTRPGSEELEEQRKKKIKNGPLFSLVVPVYHPPAGYLTQMLDSVLAQTYASWELCIANADPSNAQISELLHDYALKDTRIRIKNLSGNGGISHNTNEALGMMHGDWAGFLDHDDLLAPQALYAVAEAISCHPGVKMIYTDEDKVTEDLSEHFQPHFKPQFNLDLLRSNNYICHFLLVHRSILERTGGFRPEFNGAQDYDFVFRCAEEALCMVQAARENRLRFDESVQETIFRVPQILYHWRVHRASTADNPASKMYAFEAGKRAIAEHLSRLGVEGTVNHTSDYGFYRAEYPVAGNPMVSVIIPTKDHAGMLRTCVESLRKMTTWNNYEILIVDHDSCEEETKILLQEYCSQGIRILPYRGEFNFSAINNMASREAAGDFLVFLNNDMEIVTPDWLEQLLGICRRPEVGAAGARLVYPGGTIQHAGIIIGIGGIAGSMFVDMPANRTGYLHKASLLQDLSAVTAACMMVRKDAFFEVGGFTEKLAVAFNDVDLCLKLRRQGYLVVYDPYCQHIHYESRTRGPEDNEKKIRRFQSEIEYMRSHWISILREGDPYYDPNLSLTKWNYSLAAPK